MSVLETISSWPGVVEATRDARRACEELRWHPALRRRVKEVAAEVRVNAAWASASLEGARLPLAQVRALTAGGEGASDAVHDVVCGVVRAYAEAEFLASSGAIISQPRQALASLHKAAASALVERDQLGVPRRSDEPPADDTGELLTPPAASVNVRLEGVAELLSAPKSESALVVGGLAWAEVASMKAFASSNHVVGRAVMTATSVARGLDPLAVAVTEAAVLEARDEYYRALHGYVEGTAEGVTAWLRFVADAVVRGCEMSSVICGAVLAGKAPAP